MCDPNLLRFTSSHYGIFGLCFQYENIAPSPEHRWVFCGCVGEEGAHAMEPPLPKGNRNIRYMQTEHWSTFIFVILTNKAVFLDESTLFASMCTYSCFHPKLWIKHINVYNFFLMQLTTSFRVHRRNVVLLSYFRYLLFENTVLGVNCNGALWHDFA